MKTIFFATIALGLLQAWSSSDQDDVLRAFENQPGYVRPIGTLMGTNNNGGWVSSAQVGKLFAWEMSMSVNLAYINDKDLFYTDIRPNRCADLQLIGVSCPAGVGNYSRTRVPTVYGPDLPQRQHYMVYNNLGQEVASADTVLHGNEDVRILQLLPWVFPHAAFSIEHTRLSLRLLPFGWVNTGAFGGITILGIGLQHDFSRWLPPELPIFTSFSMGWTYSKFGYNPGRDWQGTLNVATTGESYALVVGYRLRVVEIFSEMGYETSRFSASGSLRRNRNGVEERIQPGIDISGRNGWRMALGIALHLPDYKPSVSMSTGAQRGVQINIFRFGRDTGLKAAGETKKDNQPNNQIPKRNNMVESDENSAQEVESTPEPMDGNPANNQ